MPIQPIILSGGSGSRLWPLSREHYPKQLLPLVGDLAMLQATVARLDGLQEEVAPPLVVCNEEHRFLVAEQLRGMIESRGHIILEPEGRNTAPALTLAAFLGVGRGADSIALVMPADHIVQEREAFLRAVEEGYAWAQDGYWVTFGIEPTGPETGYGYLRTGSPLAARHGQSAAPRRLLSFVEKPDRETAQAYVRSGDYLWNSGIFMMRVSLWLEAIARERPAISQACENAVRMGRADGEFYRVDAEAFLRCPSESADYAVMESVPERTEKTVVVPLSAGWSDVGAWSTLWEVSSKDGGGNVIRGDVIAHDTHDSLLMASHRVVAAVGVQDMVVVETADAVLVAHRDRAQDVRVVVEQLKRQQRSEYLTHRRVHRPWGCYEALDQGDRFQVKRIVVRPGASLSRQMHHHRAEHWIVVRGTARVTRGAEVFLLSENQSTYIPLGTAHRLENPGRLPLEIIEVQSGGYLGEDDIVRFEDAYGRTPSGETVADACPEDAEGAGESVGRNQEPGRSTR
jgi:mannose-1-phosphate guanylyltransferase / mannose-6-phosphate isomerase